MTLKTAVYEFPSPEDTEAPNGPAQIKALTDLLEATKWRSQSLKPTTGLKQGTGATLSLTTSYQDLASTTLEITPLVPSILRVWAVFVLRLSGETAAQAIGTLNLDGVDQATPVAVVENWSTSGVVVGAVGAPVNYLLSLSAAKHTIKLRAKKFGAIGASVEPSLSHYTYDLVAS